MTHARIGEIVVSHNPDDELVALGLGSCIGVVMIDAQTQVAGLAHVMLPRAPGDVTQKGKFADTAVPELLSQILALGADRSHLRVAITGGAAMFGTGGQLEIGARNDAAVRSALSATGLPCHASHTGGTQGRTARVHVGTGIATVRIAGGTSLDLLTSTTAAPPRSRPAFSRPRARPALAGKTDSEARSHRHDPAAHFERAIQLTRKQSSNSPRN